MSAERYFDNAATTPVDPRVLREALPYLQEDWGNANSLHRWGAKASEGVALARQRLASLIGVEDPAQITFTSGATESYNWVLRSFSDAAISPFEHSAGYEAFRALGFERMIPNDAERLLPLEEDHELISVMMVNNEIGTLWDARAYRDQAQFLHSDITQAVGKLPLALDGIDYASLSAHKFYGMKGIGALYCAEAALPPFIHGGEQEEGRRGGTLNVAAIVAMGAAAAIAEQEREVDYDKAVTLRSVVLEELSALNDWQVNGGDRTSPFILSLSFLGVEGETLVIELDGAGFGISSGAACSSRATEPSHVLVALGLPDDWLRGTVRISFGRFNTLDSARDLARTLFRVVENLRKMQSFKIRAT